MIDWFQNPKNGALIHAATEALIIAVSMALAYINDGNPFNLNPAWLGLITVTLQGLVSWARNRNNGVTPE